VWAINGTPADCVKLGLHAIMQQVPDLVVSGINRGSNAGRNLLYSGTVGGATEGVMHDIPSIAFSCCDFEDPDYLGAADHVRQIVNYAIDHRLAHGTLLNVNFPSKHGPRNQGCRMTRQGKEMWVEDPDQRYHPTEGHHYYWLGAKLLECDEHEDSDISWLRKGYTTAVPIHVCELTDHRVLATHKSIFETTTNTEELQPRSR
jgi:5'-nucleotidase